MASTILRYLIYGFIFGLCFPVVALFLDITFSDFAFSWQSVKKAHALNFLHWIIDCAPFVLSLMGFLIDRHKHQLEIYTKKLELQVLDRTKSQRQA